MLLYFRKNNAEQCNKSFVILKRDVKYVIWPLVVALSLFVWLCNVYRVRYWWGRVLFFNQSEARKQCFKVLWLAKIRDPSPPIPYSIANIVNSNNNKTHNINRKNMGNVRDRIIRSNDRHRGSHSDECRLLDYVWRFLIFDNILHRLQALPTPINDMVR